MDPVSIGLIISGIAGVGSSIASAINGNKQYKLALDQLRQDKAQLARANAVEDEERAQKNKDLTTINNSGSDFFGGV